MNSTAPTKPVMDVAVPKKPVFASASAARSATASILTTPVRLARLRTRSVSSSLAQPSPAVVIAPKATAQQPKAKKIRASATPVRRMPVALITVTAFVVIVLSVLAVAAYVTSRGA